MKKMLIAAVFCLSASAQAGSFKPIDFAHPQIVTGVFTDLKGHSDAGASLAIIGYGNWCPVSVGGSLGKSLGGPSLAIGTSINLLPATQIMIGGLISAIYPAPDKFRNLKELLTPAASSGPDISMSFGPQWSYVFFNGLQGKGVITWFYGANWKF